MIPTRPDQYDPVPHYRNPGRSIAMALLSTLILWSQSPAADSDDEPASHTVEKPAVRPLINKQALTSDDWVFVSKQKDTRLADTWTVRAVDDDPVLICRGAPYGYLRTNQQFADYEMELEWKFPADKNGNSGILLHTAEEDRIWPNAIQVQLHQPVAGSIFPSGDAKTDNEIRDVRDLAKPVNQWNACRISSKSGTISVEMNGKKVGEVTGCLPNSGWIALQSEGSEIHFRRIRIRELPAGSETDAPDTRTGWFVPRFAPQQGGFVPATCCPVLDPAGNSVDAQPVPVSKLTHRRRRSPRHRKSTYVVYRDALAADAHFPGSGDGLWMDVDPTSSPNLARRSGRLRRVDPCCLGL